MKTWESNRKSKSILEIIHIYPEMEMLWRRNAWLAMFQNARSYMNFRLFMIVKIYNRPHENRKIIRNYFNNAPVLWDSIGTQTIIHALYSVVAVVFGSFTRRLHKPKGKINAIKSGLHFVGYAICWCELDKRNVRKMSVASNVLCVFCILVLCFQFNWIHSQSGVSSDRISEQSKRSARALTTFSRLEN